MWILSVVVGRDTRVSSPGLSASVAQVYVGWFRIYGFERGEGHIVYNSLGVRFRVYGFGFRIQGSGVGGWGLRFVV